MWFKKMLCFIFGHNGVHKNTFYPSISAAIVTMWDIKHSCLRCGDVKEEKYVWDGKDFIKT